MSNLAIIPARGGSKRIPHKNIKDFFGKPIIAYSIEAAIKSDLFDEIMVSTDDEEIAEVAIKYGAKVPFMRSKENSDDVATTISVILEVIRSYEELGMTFQYGCCIYPAAPLISSENLKIACKMLVEEKVDAVIPVVRFSYPIQRALKIENKRLKMIWSENLNERSQDLMPTFHDSGQFYFFNVQACINQKNLLMRETLPIEISEIKSQDVDDYEDWKNLEIKYGLFNEE